MRCGNEQPRCWNCKNYGKDSTLLMSKRSSKARISSLEAENIALKERLQSSNAGSSNSASIISPAENATQVSYNTPAANNTSAQLPVPGPQASSPHYDAREPSADVETDRRHSSLTQLSVDQPGYYGRTSALFEDTHSQQRNSQKLAGFSEKSELQLMGEASKQRQLELLNYNAGRLDFDGLDPELGMHLLNLHWNRQHHSFLITYRPVFMRDMACQGPYFSKLLLNAIYFGASKFSPRPEFRNNRENLKSVGLQFRQRVRELLGGALDRSEITTIQALLIMTSSLFALGDERSAAWLYAGTAFRMIIDLGMHVDHLSRSFTRRLSDEDIEVRRRVFWGAFVVDKIQSLYQGRPISLQEADTRVPIVFHDTYEELEYWMPFAYSDTKHYSGSPAYSVSTFSQLCKLSVIMNDILNKLYTEKSEKRGCETLAEDLKDLQRDLESWEASLPTHLKLENIIDPASIPPPHVLSLQAMHKVLIILLHRPFVSEGHLHSATPSIPANSFVLCTKAATQIVDILKLYDHAFSIQHAPYLMSYATYVAATIHVRIASQRGPGSAAQISLSTCLAVFKKNQETNWAVRRAMTVIQTLMKRMNVSLATSPTVSPINIPERDLNNSAIGPNNMSSLNVPHQTATSHINTSGAISTDSAQPASPELDIDAIIQSFIHDQQNGMYNAFHISSATGQAHYGHDSGVLDKSAQPSYDIGYDDLALPTHFTDGNMMEDMLFGFNGPGLDGNV
ncbi:hypothetical protein GLAREA_06876 [Glarea lozoyensis ATCC 20868]|uniref:Xylanolytic transcriptional activator regulatory domain-containing protein n=1 Tax=Glarea lozoyensis (strain ATCC 20868 / MF5171) TaxID=1116229 RepID=S3E677_GLAL2|nr:uncharacterized protein GLAREA_06876 [Glarea lozoyensis ATCC 20868]EPE33863.1 hypothetical protein GLAREA_06876 [Glarea lozoyensis ATCC 20868]